MKNHKSWIDLAKEDLESAKILCREQIYAVALYHAHQCGEKALKAFLASCKEHVPKTHDLVGLIEVCSQKEKGFLTLLSQAEYLNPFATQFRYPTDHSDPSEKIVNEAIQYAEEMLRFSVITISL
jgi:HEPN domain-containing protein